MERHYYMYIMASLSRRLYVGVTNNLFRRTAQHKEERIAGFTQRYRIRRLVYFESFERVHSAIAREKELKGWRRSRKVALIEAVNPTWADVAEDWAAYSPTSLSTYDAARNCHPERRTRARDLFFLRQAKVGVDLKK